MNINKVVALLVELYGFLNNRKVCYAVIISQILNEVTSTQTDAEKLFIIEAAQKQLQGGMPDWVAKPVKGIIFLILKKNAVTNN